LSRAEKDELDGLRALQLDLKANIDRRHQGQNDRFAIYQNDPEGFVDKALLGFVWSKQREIMLSVRDNRSTAVQSCHDIGKTRVAALIVAWWLSCHPPGEAFAVTTAPTFDQVRALLWREIGIIHREGGLPGRVNQTEWLFGQEMVGYGRKPDDTNPTGMQGVHARRVLVVGDEACGLSAAILEAASTLTANDDSRTLLIGNPDDPATEFGKACKPGSGYNVIEVSAFDSPNFTDEEVPEWLKPLLVGKTWVEERRKKWGEESPMWKSKVLGKFPEESTDGLIPLASIAAAVARELQPAPNDPNDLGVDVARFGDDSTVMYHRTGPVARRVLKYNGKDTMVTVGHIVALHRELGFRRVKVDDIGVGGGVSDRLKELLSDPTSSFKKCEVVRINVSESPARDTEAERFKNMRGELNWNMRERFIAGLISLPGADDDLQNEAAEMKYDYQSSGHIIIEAKADMKKRLRGQSPDDWDALVLAFAEPSFAGAGFLEWMRQRAAEVSSGTVSPAVAQRPTPGAGLPPMIAVKIKQLTKLRAPVNTTTVYGSLGMCYSVDADHCIAVGPEDVDQLRALGFTPVA